MTSFIIFAVLTLSVTISALSNYLVLNFAKNLGIRNTNNVSIRWSNESKPSLGGVSMYVVFLFTGLILSISFAEISQKHQIETLGLFVSASLAFFMGLADDAYDTKPWIKLFVQITCGAILAMTNNSFTVFENPNFNFFFTILWVVTLMNSLNMLDNMDGITATTSCTILLACLLIGAFASGWDFNMFSILMLTMIGTLVGFLIFNIYPSKMFMGDGGSQFIGVIVAFFTGKVLFLPSLMVEAINWRGVVLAMVVLTPTAVDTLTVVINRLRRGQSPMIGGKDHTTHHLVYSGKNDRQVWYVFLIIGLLSSAVGLLTFWLYIEKYASAYVVGILWFLAVFYFLYRNTFLYSRPDK